MVTPSKSAPRKGTRKPVAVADAPVEESPAAVAPLPEVQAPAVTRGRGAKSKPMPFVIEPDSVAPVAEPEQDAQPEPVVAPSVESAPVAEIVPVTEPVVAAEAVAEDISAPVEAAVEVEVLTEPSFPSQPEPDVPNTDVVAAETTSAEAQTLNILEGYPVMTDAIETTKKFADEAKARLQSIATEFNDKAKVAVEKSTKLVEELSEITKGNVEALVESSKIAAKGAETLGQSAAEYGRQSFERSSATFKSFASVKSPTEFFQLQSEVLTSTFDSLAAEAAKTSEAFLKLAGDIAQPLSSRATLVSDKIKSLAA